MPAYNKEWLKKIEEQEAQIRFESFDADTALKIGLAAVEEARRQGGGYAVQLIYRDAICFQHLMEGTTAYHEWWMRKKLNACRKLGVSTLRAFCELQEGKLEKQPWMDDEGNYALNGGCVPLKYTSGEIFGYLLISGGHHEQDHQIGANALAAILNIQIPDLAE